MLIYVSELCPSAEPYITRDLTQNAYSSKLLENNFYFCCEDKEKQDSYIRSELFKILFVLFSVNVFINIFWIIRVFSVITVMALKSQEFEH